MFSRYHDAEQQHSVSNEASLTHPALLNLETLSLEIPKRTAQTATDSTIESGERSVLT
jgi:hypothetical protein